MIKLKRSIYGLKQASRQWNKRFDDEIKKFGFTQNPDEPYVKSYLGRSFAMKDLGDAAYILGIKIYRDSIFRNTKDMFSGIYGGKFETTAQISCSHTDAGYLTDADDLKSRLDMYSF
ncbi:hypothetical protein Tco_1525526 [Tanacetum coccineum]